MPEFIDTTKHQGEAVNNSSLVCKLVYKNTSFLFMGDVEEPSEEAIDRYGSWLDCDVLKVGHHGSKTSTSDPFLLLAKPEYSVISVGRNNKFKHPSSFTINKLINQGSLVFRTDKHGAVVFESDGRKVKMINWR